MRYEDPTAFEVRFDPRTNYMTGTTRLGNIYFSVPYMTQIKGNLWQGGCTNGLILPTFIEHLVSLYMWEEYTVEHELKSKRVITMYDAEDDVLYDEIIELAEHVNECVADGPTLVHCQAGLNRSALVAGSSLVLAGMHPDDAIALLREQRSPAVLCNRTFESFVRNSILTD